MKKTIRVFALFAAIAAGVAAIFKTQDFLDILRKPEKRL